VFDWHYVVFMKVGLEQSLTTVLWHREGLVEFRHSALTVLVVVVTPVGILAKIVVVLLTGMTG